MVSSFGLEIKSDQPGLNLADRWSNKVGNMLERWEMGGLWSVGVSLPVDGLSRRIPWLHSIGLSDQVGVGADREQVFNME